MMERITNLVVQTNQSTSDVLAIANELLTASSLTATSAREIATATEEIAKQMRVWGRPQKRYGNQWLTEHVIGSHDQRKCILPAIIRNIGRGIFIKHKAAITVQAYRERAMGGSFFAANPPEGAQTAFIQGTGSIQQTLTNVSAGTYAINFLAARETS